jgi:hypothetical protein
MKLTWQPIAAGLVLSLGAGWIIAPLPSADMQRAPVNPGAFAVHHGAETLAASRARFERLSPPVVEEVAPVDMGPPPPDIATVFRQNLAAIEREAAGPVVWVIDLNAQTARRKIKSGEIYQDGWVVSSINDQWVTLRRRRETRNIAVFDAPDAASP